MDVGVSVKNVFDVAAATFKSIGSITAAHGNTNAVIPDSAPPLILGTVTNDFIGYAPTA